MSTPSGFTLVAAARRMPAWLPALVMVICWGTLEAWTPAQNAPPPESMVQDDTHFFNDTQQAELSKRLQDVQRDLGVQVFFVAMTYSRDKSSWDTAARLASAWSKGSATLVLAHDRGKGQSNLAVSTEFWRRYPVDEVVSLIEAGTGLLHRNEHSAERNATEALEALIPRLRTMESTRAARNEGLTGHDLRLSMAAGAGLLVLLIIGLMIMKLSRRSITFEGKPLHFPDVQVATRLGAPFGGGTVGEAGPKR